MSLRNPKVLTISEAKDVADLIFLSMKYTFTWETMINYARQKDTWVNEIEVSQSVYKFDTRRLIKINWIKEPDYENMQDVEKYLNNRMQLTEQVKRRNQENKNMNDIRERLLARQNQ